MKKLFISVLLTAAACGLRGQDTFSITAVDSLTGEAGSAGASCVGSSTTYPHGAAILSDVIPGIGVIHTQAAWNPNNQQYAHDLMMAGSSPEEIIDSLVANDATNNPATRQYGITDYNAGHPRSAGYTGVNCMDYKNHITGPGYSIQGNILLGQEILDSMQARFLNTPGPLSDRLMAALQGAKVLGADTRCAPKGTSSQSSFLRVGKITDPYDSLYCDLWMAYPTNYPGPYPVDPIDSLQTLYDAWKTAVGIKNNNDQGERSVRVFRSGNGEITVDMMQIKASTSIVIMDVSGRVVMTAPLGKGTNRINTGDRLGSGIYLYRIADNSGLLIHSGKLIF